MDRIAIIATGLAVGGALLFWALDQARLLRNRKD
jgi:hypothetical protein